MTHINRQKFLTELSKFLTFLNDEEREKVLEKFESIFDRSTNEEELLASIDTPLKMTVEMSRAYTKGGLEEVLGMCDDLVSGQWDPDDLTTTIREQVFNAIDKETFSSVDIVTDGAEAPAEVPDPLEDDGLVAVFEQDIRESETSEEGMETSEEYSLEPETDEEETKPEETPEIPEEEKAPEETAEEPDEDRPEDDVGESPEEPSEEEPVEELEEIEEIEENAEDGEAETDPLTEEVRRDAEIIREELDDLEPEEITLKEKPRYKARWWALIPYAIVAIPLGLIGVVICAVISLAILAVAAGLVAACVLGASLALQSGMDVLADIILVAGVALVAAGLALLVIWLAVWFASNTIGGIVGGLTRLGRKWCYKEVVEA